MSMAYRTKREAADPYRLPDIETFEIGTDLNVMTNEDGEPLESGWYWWTCLPGCLADSLPSGPFASEAEALEDARSWNDSDNDDDDDTEATS